MNILKANFRLQSLSLIAMITFASCVTSSRPDPRMSKPLMTDTNEVHWRMYYEDQFDTYGKAVPPGAGEPDVAWTAYYSEKNAYAIRENNELLKEQLRLEKKHKKSTNSGISNASRANRVHSFERGEDDFM